MRKTIRTICCAIALSAPLAFTAAADARDTVIHAGTLIDGVSPAPRNRASIVIRDERILAVEPGFVTPAGAEVIDLADKTVLPGFIDLHDHPTDNPNEDATGRFSRSDAMAGIWAVINAREEIGQGFTSVRDLGSDGTAIPVLNEAIAAKNVIGPRYWAALEALSPTGGHSDPMNGLPDRISFADRALSVVDGPDAIRIAVREHHRRGAKVIKLMVSGGVGSVGDDPATLFMTEEEIRTAVETAHSLGMIVAAHAHGKLAIDVAVRAGVDSIEHGTFADAETYRLMKQHGTVLVPTLLIADAFLKVATEHPEQLRPTAADKAKRVLPLMSRNASNAYAAGVTIGFGTDYTAGSGRRKTEEFALLVKAGMRPIDAIFAATRNAARLLRAEQDIGSVQAGRFADIVAVTGNPLADIAVLQRVEFVMKGGQVIKANGHLVEQESK